MIKGGGGAPHVKKSLQAALINLSALQITVNTSSNWVNFLFLSKSSRWQPLKSLQTLYHGRCSAPREGFITDNGNCILDVSGLNIDNPSHMETEIQSPGLSPTVYLLTAQQI